MDETNETSSYLILQGQREDGVWFDQASSQWTSEAGVRNAHKIRVGNGYPSRLVRRETVVTVTETVVQ